MLLEQRSVSRKTPLDGKLEISPDSAARIGPLGPAIPLTSGGREGTARLHFLACTCARGEGGSHVHHFLESALFRALQPESQVQVELDEARGAVRVEAVAPKRFS